MRYKFLAGCEALLCLAACGRSRDMAPPEVIHVTVAPTKVSLHLAKTQQFTATVHNSGNQAVTWSVTGVGCSRAGCGTIDAGGLYIAPSTVPGPGAVSITATAAADSMNSGTGVATILPAVVVNVAPNSPTVRAGKKQEFTAAVVNAIDRSVLWSVTGSGCRESACGTINRDGLYTAPSVPPSPATVTVKATSVEDTTKSDGSVVMILPAGTAIKWRAHPKVLRGTRTQAMSVNAARVPRVD